MDFLKNFSEVALGFVVELLKLMPIMIFVFGFKLQPVKRIVFFGLCAIILLILSVNFEMRQHLPIYTLISILLTLFIVHGNNRIIFTVISCFGISILDMLVATLWLVFNNQSYSQLANDTTKHVIINSINIATILTVCLIARTLYSRQKHILPQNVRKSYLILIMIGEISLFLLIDHLTYH